MSRKNSHRKTLPLRVLRLEDRTLPANLVWVGDVSGSWGANVSGNTNWFNASTNTDNAIPHDGDDLSFQGAAGNHTNTNNLSGLSIHSITFGGTDYVVGGNAITLTSSLSDTSSSGSNALNLPITLTGTLSASVSATSTRLTLGGVISGSGALTKSGNGFLRLSGASANTYTGPTTVSAGTLELNKNGAVAAVAGNLTINSGGTVRDVTNGNQIAGTSTVTVAAGGIWDTNNLGDTISALTVNGGSVTTGSGLCAAGTVTMTGGSITSTGFGKLKLSGNLTTNAAPSSAIISGQLDLNGATRTIIVNDGPASFDLDISAVISNGGIVKDGAGTLRLSGSASNTYTDETDVRGGRLQLAKTGGALALSGNLTVELVGNTLEESGNQIADTSTVTVFNGSFDVNDQIDTVGPLSTAGGPIRIGTGTLTAGPVTMTGGTIASLGAGKLVLQGNVTTNANSISASISGNLDLGGLTRIFTVADGTAAPDLDIAAVVTNGALTKAAGGTLRLSGSASNTYSGLTTVSAGTLELGKNSLSLVFLGGLIVNGGVARELLGNQLPDAASVTVSAGSIFDLNGQTDTIGPLTVSSGSVTIGTGTLAAGPVTMTGGSIASTDPGKLVLQGNVTANASLAVATITGNLNLGGATRTFTIGVGGFAAMSITAAISNGGVDKSGAGILVLDGSASNTYTGTTTVSAGQLQLVKTGGALAVAGNLTINGGAANEDFGNQIADTSTVAVTAGGAFNLNNPASDVIGPLTVNGGSVNAGTGTLTAGSVTMTGGSIASTGAGKLVLLGGITTVAASAAATISGNLDLGGDFRLFNIADGAANPDLDISAAISHGAVQKQTGTGTLRYSGTQSNTYGATFLNSGTLELAKSGGAIAIAADVEVGDGVGGAGADVLRLLADNQIADSSPVLVSRCGLLALNNFVDTFWELSLGNGDNSAAAVTTGTGMLTLGGDVTVFTDGTTGASGASIAGNLSLGGATRTFTVPDGGAAIDLDITAVISATGSAGLTELGPGTLRLDASASNIYTGPTTVNAGTLELAKNGGAVTALAVRDLLLSGGSAREIFSNQVADTSRVTVNSGAKFDLNGQADTVGPLSVAGGIVTIGTGTLTAGPVTMTGGGIGSTGLGRLVLLGNVTTNGASFSAGQIDGRLDLGGATRTFDVGDTTSGLDLRIAALISGTGSEGLIKTGPGDLQLAGLVSNTYTGPTTVSAGTLRLFSDGNAVPGNLTISGGTVREDGINQIADTSTVTVNSGGTFNVNGLTDTIGPLTVAGGTLTTIAPSASRLTAGNTSFDAAATLKMKLVGAANSDRITVNGTLAVGGTLQLSLPSPVAVGTTITLLDNDGTDPVTGTFNGLPPGAVLTVGGQTFTISYAGGDGNDVTVTAFSATAPAVTGQPANQTAGEGNPVIFTASASGIPTPTVQWQVSTNGGATFTDIPGATSPNLTFNAALSQSGNLFRAVFTNSAGTATTNTATLTVVAKPTAFTFNLDVPRDTPRPLTLVGFDPAGRSLTFIVTAPPQHGTLSGTAPNLTYTPAAGYVGPDSLQYKVNNGFADSNVASVSINVFIPGSAASVTSVTIDNGTAQRSMVRSLTVTFSAVVSFVGPAGNAFQLAQAGRGNVTLDVDLTGSTATRTVARLTFSGPLTEGANSLVDGNYTLTVFSGQVQGGVQGGDNVSTLFRLFGDVNGDRAVNGLDLTAFRNAFGAQSTDAAYIPFLDFNGDGAINGTDLTQFRNRFGVILP